MPVALDQKAEARQARTRAAKIREGIHNYLETLALIAEAWGRQDWRTLGYDSWESYVDEEFGEQRLHLPTEHRQKAVYELRLAGMSNRAIAPAAGVSEGQVRRDLAQVRRGVAPEVPNPQPLPGSVKGRDGKVQPAVRTVSKPSTDERPADEPDQSASFTNQGAGSDVPNRSGERPDRAEFDPAPTKTAGTGGPAPEPPTAAPEPAVGGSTPQDRPKPPKWDPAEREAHEADVARIRDIEAARRAAKTIQTTVRSEVVTIVTGCRYGEKGLVTADMIADLRSSIDLLEREVDDGQ